MNPLIAKEAGDDREVKTAKVSWKQEAHGGSG
jgi:hypothetical protein